jgi:diacylglycerol kinase (ATP)
VDVILNLVAQRLAKRGALRDALLGAERLGARVIETASLAELDDAVRSIAARGTDRVVLAGGDGSYSAGVTALARVMSDRMPSVALAPGGTVSTVARNWGLRGQGARDAERIVRRALDTSTPDVLRPTLRVEDDRGGDRVGFIFGAGLVASFFDAYYAAPEQGYASAARITARVFAGSFVGGALARRVLERAPLELTVDGARQEPNAWSLVVASVVRDMGLHMHLAYRAAERFDRFHVVASALEAGALGPQMPRVLAGRALRGAHHVDTLAETLALRFTSDRGRYVLDGDVFAASLVRASFGPALRVMVA